MIEWLSSTEGTFYSCYCSIGYNETFNLPATGGVSLQDKPGSRRKNKLNLISKALYCRGPGHVLILKYAGIILYIFLKSQSIGSNDDGVKWTTL